MVARIRELESLLGKAVNEKENWRIKASILAGSMSENLCDLRDQVNQMNTDYQEDLNYTKEYFEDRMQDLLKACSRQASKEQLIVGESNSESARNYLGESATEINIVEMRPDDDGTFTEPNITD